MSKEKKMIDRIEVLLEENPNAFTPLVEKLEKAKEYKLPQVLQKKQDSLKNTPMDEEDIAEHRDMLQKQVEAGEMEYSESTLELVESIYSTEELKELQSLHDITLTDLVKFSIAVTDKVFGLREEDENGELHLKEVASQKELQPLFYDTQKLIRKESKKHDRKVSQLQDSVRGFGDQKTQDISEVIQANKKLAEEVKESARNLKLLARKHSRIETDEMSEWELDLLQTKMIAMAHGNYTPPAGKN